MKKSTSSVDGFIPRRSNDQLGDKHSNSHHQKPSASQQSKTAQLNRRKHSSPAGRTVGVAVQDISDSLRGIDTQEAADITGQSKPPRGRKVKKPLSRRRRIIKWSIIALVVLLLGVLVYVGVRFIINGGKIFQGNLFDVLTQSEPLKQDANGRSNILVFGTAEDDEGGMHGGANLTDSIMVVSVNQTTKDAYMVSLPRDLYVRHDPICQTMGTNAGRINETYSCASNDGQDEAAGAKELSETVGEVLGLDIQYYVHLNFTAVVQAVDAVGGVEVTIESSDPRGILDRNFDWKCGYQCYYVNYKNGETVQLDGERALALARARNASGGYGLPGGNYDREKNQQKIIKALREKALSAGTLANLGAVTGLMEALGNNLRTNVQGKEIRTVMSLASDIQSDAIKQLPLVDDEAELAYFVGQSIGGASVQVPAAGLYDYSDIHQYVKENLSSDPVTKEKARLVVLNGSGVAGAAQTEADKLEEAGMVVASVDNAPEGSYGKVEVYVLDPAKTATKAKFEELYGSSAVKLTSPPVAAAPGTSFVVIVGA